VVISYGASPDKAEAVAHDLESRGIRVIAVQTDQADPDDSSFMAGANVFVDGACRRF
jgi:hypothetical protein